MNVYEWEGIKNKNRQKIVCFSYRRFQFQQIPSYTNDIHGIFLIQMDKPTLTKHLPKIFLSFGFYAFYAHGIYGGKFLVPCDYVWLLDVFTVFVIFYFFFHFFAVFLHSVLVSSHLSFDTLNTEYWTLNTEQFLLLDTCCACQFVWILKYIQE